MGYVTGEPDSSKTEVITSEPFAVGEYVIVDHSGSRVLGMVEKSTIRSATLSDVPNFEHANELVGIVRGNTRDKRHTASVSLVGSLEAIRRGRPEMPAVPPLPGSEVRVAGAGDLRPVFAPDGAGWARVGTLLRARDVDVRVNLDKAVSRHVAILAMTGMGKSNTVSLLTREMASRGGTVIIFDYHGEYSSLRIPGINMLDAKINPRRLGSEELAEMLDFRANADKQRAVLSRALTNDVRKAKDFWKALIDSIRVSGDDAKKSPVISRVVEKVEYAIKRMGDMLDPEIDDPMALIKPGRANVLGTSEFGEKQANAAIAFYMRNVLEDRKEATIAARRGRHVDVRFEAPVFMVIEEAHVFIPKDRDTGAKDMAAKIAREGRKFGVGMCIVSQRPRALDLAVLSQMSSFAVMRMIQQDDQRQVEAASESAGKALIMQLASLNVGEAILTGQWVPLNAMVSIDEVLEKESGADQSATADWKYVQKSKSVGVEKTGEMIQNDSLVAKEPKHGEVKK
ncbi:MAG: ATP-binding protein [Thaumarchaeota archaeon S15]|nr:MAG: ATP-binding protein [Thaumarchaeota archaeon S15]